MPYDNYSDAVAGAGGSGKDDDGCVQDDDDDDDRIMAHINSYQLARPSPASSIMSAARDGARQLLLAKHLP